ncbi:MAG: chemotaxis protein CheW [Acidobacteriota bacterium]
MSSERSAPPLSGVGESPASAGALTPMVPDGAAPGGLGASDLESGAAMLRELVRRIDGALDDGRAGAAAPDPGPSDDASPAADPGPATPSAPEAPAVPRDQAAFEGEGGLHLIFELAGSSFAIPAVGLAEVKVYEEPMPIPGVPPWILGIESFRGEALSVTDLAAFLGFSKLTGTELARLIVVHDPRSPKRVLTGLAVDAVATHEWLPGHGGRDAGSAALTGRLGRFTQRILDIGDRALAVLDLEGLLDSEEFRGLEP